jgi:hypothetical protein
LFPSWSIESYLESDDIKKEVAEVLQYYEPVVEETVENKPTDSTGQELPLQNQNSLEINSESKFPEPTTSSNPERME